MAGLKNFGAAYENKRHFLNDKKKDNDKDKNFSPLLMFQIPLLKVPEHRNNICVKTVICLLC